jgi:RNA polymerase sigma factor (sigma-70 family)
LSDVGGIENPRAYLYQIARNQAIDLLRIQARDRGGVEFGHGSDKSNLSGELQGEQINDSTVDATIHDPARIILAQQELDVVHNTLNEMSEKRRKYLKMSRFDNLSNVEIAKRAGVSEAAIRKHIARALLDIKRALGAEMSEVG